MLLRHQDLHPLQAVLFQGLLHALVGTGCDLVDHAPGEGELLLGIGIGLCGHIARRFPGIQDLEEGATQLFSIMGAVVHGDQSQGLSTGLIPGQAACSQLGQEALGLLRGRLHIRLHRRSDGIALLCDGEGHHLQTGLPEDLLHPAGVLGQSEALGQRAHDLLFHGPVRQKAYRHSQIVIGAQGVGDHLTIIALAADNASIPLSPIQKPLAEHRRKGAKDIARSKMQPCRSFHRAANHGLPVVLRQSIALGCSPLLQDRLVQFHKRILLNPSKRRLSDQFFLVIKYNPNSF